MPEPGEPRLPANYVYVERIDHGSFDVSSDHQRGVHDQPDDVSRFVHDVRWKFIDLLSGHDVGIHFVAHHVADNEQSDDIRAWNHGSDVEHLVGFDEHLFDDLVVNQFNDVHDFRGDDNDDGGSDRLCDAVVESGLLHERRLQWLPRAVSQPRYGPN